MRGLWRKDYYLGRKYLLLAAVIGALLIFMAYWLRLAFIYGNLRFLPQPDRQETLRGLDMGFPALPGVALLFITIKAVNVSVYADRQAGWNRYLLATPLGERVIVRAKYLEFIGAEVAALTLGLIAAGVYGLCFGFDRVRIGCVGLAGAFLLAVLCECIMLPLAYRYASENIAVGGAFLGMLLPGYLTMGIFFVTVSDPEQTLRLLGNWCASHLRLLFCAELGMILLALAASCFLSLSVVKKRKWCEKGI